MRRKEGEAKEIVKNKSRLCSKDQSNITKVKKSPFGHETSANGTIVAIALFVLSFQHIERVHLGLRQVHCEVCGKGFVDKNQLKRHQDKVNCGDKMTRAEKPKAKPADSSKSKE